MNPQRAIRDIAHFEHLAVCDTRLHKGRRYVNHQAKPRESAPSLEESTEIAGQLNPLSSDAVNRAAGFEHVRFFEWMDSRVVAIIGVLPKVDGSVAGLEHANLVSQGEIDGRGTELLGS